jgi:hypothetical protein
VYSAYVEFKRDHFFLLCTDSTYSRIPGDKGGLIFYRRFFSALVLCTNWCTTICITCPILPKIECNEFEYNKFLLVLVQIDLIQFEYSNCIRSIRTKTNTNLLHANSIHSNLHKKLDNIALNWTRDTNCSTPIVRKMSAKKNLV